MAELNNSVDEEAAISKKPPVANFPLPRELRDEIYEYLLRPVKESRQHKFHTNLLAVNHTVHEETEEYLYHNNEFAVVSFDWGWPKGGALPPLDRISYVSQSHVARMEHHNLRIHFVRHEDYELKGPEQSAILHVDDLQELCLSMQLDLARIYGPGVLVDASLDVNGLPVARFSGPKYAYMVTETKFSMELRDTKYRCMSAKHQEKL